MNKEKIWINPTVGMTAPGLGTVIATQQMCPDKDVTALYAGYNGYLCLIVLSQPHFMGLDAKFATAPWFYGDDEPRQVTGGYPTLEIALDDFNKQKALM